MTKKLLKPIALIVIIIVVAALTWIIFYGSGDADMVLKVPAGFVKLQSYLTNGLSIMPFETQIGILDAEKRYIYQTGFKNRDFIVRYDGEYYVNEEKIKEIAEVASIAPEQRLKTYSLGDAIEIRGTGEARYFVTINSLKEGETEPLGTDTLTTYTIKYTVTSNVPVDRDPMKTITAETELGVTYSLIDFIDTEIIRFQVRNNENIRDKITAIYLRSPDYPGLSYRVDVY